MFAKFLRENKIAAGVLTVLRLYLGFHWMTAGWGKLTGDGFNAAGYLNNAVANPVMGSDGTMVYGWYVSFLEAFALPNIGLFNFMIPMGEFLVGLGLILGCFTTAAAFFGLLMNFSFMFAGTVSSNPMDVLLGGIILFAGYNAGRIGLDRYVMPFLRKTLNKNVDVPVKETA
ncbi:DoxX family protein [Bacillus sp. B15-48]|uniref:DoxX family protein n=1 Tax=Bacillus sp. B15-48 TaxID=1548601 RepID=UPI00194014A0|nr:DoxX family protein [Bacillus sp. B15-48]MBM4760920.1 DoxX family membrane protein [Bacillus sp. B15-48]